MFEIGDRVVCIKDYDVPLIGREATVVFIYGGGHLALEFDERVGPRQGHSCDGRAKMYHGWNVSHDCVQLVEKDSRSSVERRCRRLWNNSKWVKAHPTMAY